MSRAPRKLIAAVSGIEFVELNGSDVCCGFGGTFAVKYPEISNAIAAGTCWSSLKKRRRRWLISAQGWSAATTLEKRASVLS